jgi:hypothetical protein
LEFGTPEEMVCSPSRERKKKTREKINGGMEGSAEESVPWNGHGRRVGTWKGFCRYETTATLRSQGIQFYHPMAHFLLRVIWTISVGIIFLLPNWSLMTRKKDFGGLHLMQMCFWSRED